MIDLQTLHSRLHTKLKQFIQSLEIVDGEITLEIASQHLCDVCLLLRDDDELQFNMLIDVCGVDYLRYGFTDWTTDAATDIGFSRGVEASEPHRVVEWNKPRFAVVYHLLSLPNNSRLRLRTFVDNDDLIIDSVIDIWNSANWFEREAFDLFGILFDGHPDLRRILTDYGFVGHPFRKDFPLSGHVEMRYDAKQQRIVYEPVDIEPRVTVPRVIRLTHRHLQEDDIDASSNI